MFIVYDFMYIKYIYMYLPRLGKTHYLDKCNIFTA